MKIYTKTGDTGKTALFGGSRVDKDSIKVWCYGSADEAMCAIGMARAYLQEQSGKSSQDISAGLKEVADIVKNIQLRFYMLEAELASDGSGLEKLKDRVSEADVSYLEKMIDEFTDRQDKNKLFPMPGDTEPSALFHTARAAVRQTERYVVTLSKEEQVSPFIMQYLNRLSDLMFVFASYYS